MLFLKVYEMMDLWGNYFQSHKSLRIFFRVADCEMDTFIKRWQGKKKDDRSVGCYLVCVSRGVMVEQIGFWFVVDGVVPS